MFTSDVVAYLWHLWVDLFGGLGLPWSKQVTASHRAGRGVLSGRSGASNS